MKGQNNTRSFLQWNTAGCVIVASYSKYFYYHVENAKYLIIIKILKPKLSWFVSELPKRDVSNAVV